MIARKGDILLLREWDPKKKKYTGRVIEKKVTYLARWSKDEVEKYGYQIIGLREP